MNELLEKVKNEIGDRFYTNGDWKSIIMCLNFKHKRDFELIVDRVAELYAEEYHQSELLKLNKSDVISSVCICKCVKEASCPVCKDCFIKGLEREQTDL